uniref:Gamma-glutamyltransferase 5a n=1 Tax=Cyprinodon variegatus TaxID=28743 RepID=A0A3Q2E023_CYPVA
CSRNLFRISAADSEFCRDMLQCSDSAVDGAIAVGRGFLFKGNVKIINSRETAPSNVDPHLLKSCSQTFTLTSCSWLLHHKPTLFLYFCRSFHEPLVKFSSPTIKLAREGFPIPVIQGAFIKTLKVYSDENGNRMKTGDIIKFEKLADVEGYIGIGSEVQKQYRYRIASAKTWIGTSLAWVVPMGDYQMYITPPPSGGALLSLVLNIMKGCCWMQTSDFWILSVKRMKQICVENQLKLKLMRKAEQKMNSMSSSIGLTFICCFLSDSPDSHRSESHLCCQSLLFFWQQPPSSMASTVLKSRSKTLVIGGSGGSMITTGLALINHLWFGKSLKEAIDAPVVFVDSENALKFEPKCDKVMSLEHNQKEANQFYNVVNLIETKLGCICAVSEQRKKREAAGC